jgi:N6-adenosine-specific RNA methylase IME4
MTARPDAPTSPMTAAGQALASPPCSRFRCIVADPPWPLSMRGKRKRAKEPKLPDALPYPTMTMDEICAMPIGELAAEDCHLWLWTTNQHLNDGFRVMREWGFRYLVPIHWIKPSGVGNWFIHRTQTILFGYREKCRFPAARYLPNILETGDPKRHSQKPEESYRLVESVSPGPRLELFARTVRPGWSAWGNEVPCDVEIDTSNNSITGAR